MPKFQNIPGFGICEKFYSKATSDKDEYANKLLGHALELWDFADRYRKEYHFSVPQVTEFYKSWSGYKDELCWAATWLYRASEGKFSKIKI